jgi:D-alanyl-lipoteichoic acid acyltransferase DltB (MBOAT superfamily)
MVRCMANNYSTFGFWRSWHRSYNLWVIRCVTMFFFSWKLFHVTFLFRYIYVPVGGSKNVILNTVLVFSFVALWHDLTFRLLAWGWLVSLFIIPELAASYLLSASKVYFWSTSLSTLLLIYTTLVREIFMVSTCLCCWRCLEYYDDDGCQSGWICCRH